MGIFKGRRKMMTPQEFKLIEDLIKSINHLATAIENTDLYSFSKTIENINLSRLCDTLENISNNNP